MFYEDTGQFTPEQIKLAKEIASRIKKLKKSGCAIVARQDNLYAYIHKEWDNSTCDITPYPLKYLDCGNITDAGADDEDYLEEWYLEND